MLSLATNNPSDDTETPAPQTPMGEFANLPWGSQEAEDWAGSAATRINDYDQKKAIADANDRAGNAFVASLDNFRKGLVSRTAADPYFIHTAFDLAADTIPRIVNAHPNLSDDERSAHHDALVADLNNQIAVAGVKSMAERDGHIAATMLAAPRIAAALSDDDRKGLASYIGSQEIARGADRAAQQIEREKAATAASAAAAVGHAGTLYSPQLGEPAFPPGFATRLMADPAVGADDKAELMHLYARLQTGGDAAASDPITVQRALAGGMDHRDVLREAGNSLRLVDALGLAKSTLPTTPEDRAKYMQAADVIQQARTQLYGPNGENGAAGHAAWGRFVNWMLPTLRMGGADMADANTHPLNWLGRFAPTGDDVVPRPPPQQPQPKGRYPLPPDEYIEPPPAERPSLKEIFGR